MNKGTTPVSPSYLMTKFLEKKRSRFSLYASKSTATEAGKKMMLEDIEQLEYIASLIQELEPIGLMQEVSKVLRRNSLLDVDITVIVIPNRLNIPPYPSANARLADLTDCNIPDARAIWEMHRDGLACVEVDDFSGNNINDPLSLYANRGALFTEK